MGSMWLATRNVAAEWSEERYLLADILDSLNVMASGRRYESEIERIERPAVREHKRMQRQKAARIRERLNNTKWEEVENIG